MNGAESLLAAMTRNGIDVCFAQPGTSELHFVGALDRAGACAACWACSRGPHRSRGRLRPHGRPPGLDPAAPGAGPGNGLANLHNAMRAHVSDRQRDRRPRHLPPPLRRPARLRHRGNRTSVRHWVRTSPSADDLAADAAAAVAAARTAPGRVASLILPADASWTPLTTDRPAGRGAVPPPPPVSAAAVDAAARILRSGETAALILGPEATRELPLERAGQIAAATGARLYAPTHTARIDPRRGARPGTAGPLPDRPGGRGL